MIEWIIDKELICWKCGTDLNGANARREEGNEMATGVTTEVYCSNDGWVWFGEVRMWHRGWALQASEQYKQGKSPL